MPISTAIDPNAVASIVGIETKFVNTGLAGNFLPQRVAVVGQGNTLSAYSAEKRQVTTAFEVGQLYGFGSPLYLSVLQLLPLSGDGVGSIPVTVYPLADAGTGVAAIGDLTPSGAQTVSAAYRVSINDILSNEFVIAPGYVVADVVAAMIIAINSNLNMPMVASDGTTKLDLTSKWKGASANDLKIKIIGSATAGVTFAITQPAGGLVNPDVQSALDQVGDVWETLLLNCLDKADTVTLDKFTVWGEGRWVSTVKKPALVFTGDVNATVAAATAIPEARKTDRINVQLVSPASFDLPFVVAARQLARIAIVAEDNPPTGYNGRIADGLVPSLDSEAWDWLERDEAVKKGSSTITIENGQVVLGDIVTFYHPDGDPYPAYRKVVNVIKIQNIIYNMDLIFEALEWRDAPLIPDLTATVNPNARKPASARAEISRLLAYLGDWALISDPDDAKKKTLAQINPSNPDRLDIVLVVKISGNSNIKSITINFGYLFGGQS